jgi:penicillin-binding protein 1B
MAKKNTKKAPPKRRSLLRGTFVLGVMFFCLVFLGSIFVKYRVTSVIKSRLISSSAMILSRSFPVTVNTNIYDVKLIKRLQSLRYFKTNSTPSSSGEYSLSGNELYLYPRSFVNPNGKEQRSFLLKLNLDERGTITSILDTKFNLNLNSFWLEPQIVSSLASGERRISSPRALEDFSPKLKEAILSIEDQRFYKHLGVDPIAIGRAIFSNIRAGGVVQGGSTLTQQLAKNLFFSSKQSLARKALEALTALSIEAAFTKDQIFEFYLNEIFLVQEGNLAIHGFAEASKSFFKKDVKDLSLAEAATLAGISKGPSYYSPRRSPERAKARRKVVLQTMVEMKYITQEQADQASAVNLQIYPAQNVSRVAPYFVDYLKNNLSTSSRALEALPKDASLHTGLDIYYQQCAEESLTKGLEQLERNFPALRKNSKPIQSALISVSANSGEIRAWVGGRDYGKNQYDRVSLAKRQPGSAFKPFVYLTALDPKLNTYRVARTTFLLSDKPITIKTSADRNWEPENYDKNFRGEVTVREALTKSLNIPTVNMALKVGINNIANTAKILGITSNLSLVPSLALGAVEVTPLELARAYTTLANQGILTELRPITAISTEEDTKPLVTNSLREKTVATEDAVYILTDILKDVVNKGTGTGVRSLGFTRPVAGKTGTSNDKRDSWFAGYTPTLLTIVWVGFDDNSPTSLTGATGALPIWTEYMKCVSPMEPDLDFVPPPNIVYRDVDVRTGLLATSKCSRSDIKRELFINGTEPITPCPLHYRASGIRRDNWFWNNENKNPKSPVDIIKGWFE